MKNVAVIVTFLIATLRATTNSESLVETALGDFIQFK